MQRVDRLQRTPLLLDACVAINLAATDRVEQIAQTTDVTFILARQAAQEVGHLRDTADGEMILTPIDLSRYNSTTLKIVGLVQPEYSLYVELTRTVDEGEAATIAVAVKRSLALAASLPQAQLRGILVKIRDRASFQPPRNDPDLKWWQDIVDVP